MTRTRRGVRMSTVATVVLQNLGVAAACWGTGQLGLLAGEIGANISPLWPPTGVALAAVLVLGRRVLPGVMTSAFFTEIALVPLAPALAGTAAVTATALAGFMMLRAVGFRLEIDRFRDALALVFLGAFASTLISSTVGSVMRVWSGLATPGEYWQIWLVWWTGDTVGILLVTPFLLAIRLWRWPPRLRWYEGVEIAVMLAASLVAPLFALPALDAFYLAFPIIGWAAWRYQLAGVAPCTLIVSVATTNAAVRMVGPFADQDVLVRVLSLQLFNLTLVLGALLFASAISERNSARFEIERTCDRLSEVIDHIEETEAGRRRDGA